MQDLCRHPLLMWKFAIQMVAVPVVESLPKIPRRFIQTCNKSINSSWHNGTTLCAMRSFRGKTQEGESIALSVRYRLRYIWPVETSYPLLDRLWQFRMRIYLSHQMHYSMAIRRQGRKHYRQITAHLRRPDFESYRHWCSQQPADSLIWETRSHQSPYT